jgi:hypothetical protein
MGGINLARLDMQIFVYFFIVFKFVNMVKKKSLKRKKNEETCLGM